MPANSREDVFERLGLIARPFLGAAQELFLSKRVKCSGERGLWSELVYCVLAGTQVPMETAARATAALEAELQGQFEPAFIASLPEPEATVLVADKLRSAGYRYHTTKARTVVAAAHFVQTVADGSLKGYLASSSVASAEKALRQCVPGVGKKIANHWLRNAGMDTCTIDVHLKRLFVLHGLYDRDPEAQTPEQEFERLVGIVRHVARVLGAPIAESQFALWLAARAESKSEHP